MVNPAQGAAKLTVYHLEHSRSLRLLWLLEHLELEYDIKTFKRDPKTKLAPKEAKEIHPLGRFPMLTIEENGQKTALAETSAIMVQLVERYGAKSGLLPDTSDWAARHRVQYWIAYAEDSIMSPLMYAVIFAQAPKQAPFIARPLVAAVGYGAMASFVRPLINEHLRWVESQLADSDYLGASKLSLGDFVRGRCDGTDARR